MKIYNWLPLLAVTLLLVACGSAKETTSGNTASINDFSVSTTEASATEGDFIYRLVSEQEEFASGGPIELYAELEYIGEQDSIDISHAGSAFYFPMEKNTRL